MSPILPIETTARPASSGALQEITVRRRHGEVLAMSRADEILRVRPDERPRDNPSDVQRIAKAARDAAKLVKPLEPERLLVRGDLEHRIRRCVADRLAGADMLFAKLLDDHGAGCVPIPENSRRA